MMRASMCRQLIAGAIVEESVNTLGHFGGNPLHGLEIVDAGARDGFGRSEMLQERALAGRADTLDLVERIDAERLGALCTMCANGEAVRFVAQALDEIQNGVARLEHERGAAGEVEMLAARVAI